MSERVHAYASVRLHRAVPSHQGLHAALRRAVAARDQARRLRVIGRKDGGRVRLYSRPGNDLTERFPLIVEALAHLRSRSCIIDGEAVACGDDGVPSFDRIRYRRYDARVFLLPST